MQKVVKMARVLSNTNTSNTNSITINTNTAMSSVGSLATTVISHLDLGDG